MIPAGLHFAHYGTGEGEKQVSFDYSIDRCTIHEPAAGGVGLSILPLSYTGAAGIAYWS